MDSEAHVLKGDAPNKKALMDAVLQQLKDYDSQKIAARRSIAARNLSMHLETWKLQSVSDTSFEYQCTSKTQWIT
jgi:secreted protein with Ig-like and vWFA domain